MRIPKSVCFSYRAVERAALIYLSVPAVIFLFSFIKPVIGGLAALVVLLVLFYIWKSEINCQFTNSPEISIRKDVLFCSFAVLLLWSFLGGHGGFLYQSDDWGARNAIFADLIRFSWPVIYPETNTALVYYIGYWLPMALIGKIAFWITSSFKYAWIIANVALWLWTAIGTFIAVFLLCFFCRADSSKKQFIILIIFIFFSGLDLLGCLINRWPWIKYLTVRHLEWWADNMQFSSNTTCLYWVFNQAVPGWILTLYMLNEFKQEKSIKNLGFAIIVTMICSPFPCVGVCIYAFYYVVIDMIRAIKNKRFKDCLWNIFSLPNVLSLFAVFPFVASYLMSNAAYANTSGLTVSPKVIAVFSACILSLVLFFIISKKIPDNVLFCGIMLVSLAVIIVAFRRRGYNIWRYFLFLFFEAGCFLIPLYRSNKRNILYYSTIFIVCLCPLITVGYAFDFCMRVSIPAVIIMAALTCEYLTCEENYIGIINRICTCLLVACLVIGSATSTMEVLRGFFVAKECGTLVYPYKEPDTFWRAENADNFIVQNYQNCFFYKYFSK